MQPKRPFYAIIAAALLLAACDANTYDRIETGGTERINVRLDESAAVLVTTPKDGGYGGKVYNGSGAIVARRIDASFSRYARLVDVYPSEYRSLNDLKDVIAKNGYGYIAIPTIVTWAYKDSDWSKIANQVSVKISVLDATTGKEISSNFLEGKGASPSSLYSLFDSNPEKPEQLLSELADGYVDNLYGAILVFPHG